MKISVIIPVYNAEKYIRKAVESALKLPEVAEIILVEDGSPDNGLSICRQLEAEDNRVKLFRHPNGENRGAGASRNLGIEKATQEFISFLDADDYYLQNRFEKDLEILINNKDVFGVYNAMGIFNYTKNKYDEKLTTIKGFVKSNNLYKELWTQKNINGYFSIVGVTVRKSVFNCTGLFNVDLKLHQDTDWIMKLVSLYKLAPGILNEPTCIRGVHNFNRINNTTNNNYESKLLLNKSLVKWLIINNNKRRYLKYPQAYIALYSFLENETLKNKVWVLYRTALAYDLLNNKLFFKEILMIVFKENSTIANFLLKLHYKITQH